jgi:hypothetical protein
MNVKLLGLISFMVFFTGCVNHKIAIEHTSDNVKGNNTGIICLNKFDDTRVEKERIGFWVNGFGFESGDILTEQDISTLISKTVEKELKNLGYTVELVKVAQNSFDVNANDCTFIDGNIKVLYIETKPSLIYVYSESIIIVDMLIQNESGREYKKTFTAEDKTKGFVLSASLGKKSIDIALSKLILKIKSELPSVIGI